jgi:hypothetical protein
VRSLREAAGQGIAPTWRGSLDFGDDPALLYHLPPPADARDRRWTEVFRYGLCHFRVGPGFVTVVDHRRGTTAPILLRDPAEIAILHELAEPRACPASPAFSRLVDRGLVLRHAGKALSLPYRLRRWPIPCTAI